LQKKKTIFEQTELLKLEKNVPVHEIYYEEVEQYEIEKQQSAKWFS